MIALQCPNVTKSAVVAAAERAAEMQRAGAASGVVLTAEHAKAVYDATEGGDAEEVLSNAARREGMYFVAPKVLE